jgi:hypothetical protein
MDCSAFKQTSPQIERSSHAGECFKSPVSSRLSLFYCCFESDGQKSSHRTLVRGQVCRFDQPRIFGDLFPRVKLMTSKEANKGLTKQSIFLAPTLIAGGQYFPTEPCDRQMESYEPSNGRFC